MPHHGDAPGQQAAAPVQALAQAAASGQYPNLVAALAAAGPARGEDDVFESQGGEAAPGAPGLTFPAASGPGQSA